MEGYLQEVAILIHPWSIECIHPSSNSYHKIVIVNQELAIPIKICPNIRATMDFLVLWVNLEAFCFPKFDFSTFLLGITNKNTNLVHWEQMYRNLIKVVFRILE